MNGIWTVETGSRLHFGPLAISAEAGRYFGGLGLMINHPQLCVTACAAVEDCFFVPPHLLERVQQIVQSIRTKTASSPCCELRVESQVPAHAGFGSGTQLALAIARAFSQLRGDGPLTARELAGQTGRGARSAIGIGGFETGGLLVDAGRKHPERPGLILQRVSFPEDWPIVLLRPAKSLGLSGEAETQAFKTMDGMPAGMTDRLCRLLLLEILPGVLERDHGAFSSGLYEYGRLVGEFFAPYQGGTWVHPVMQTVADQLPGQGFPGFAQSSWGPTLAVFCEEPAAVRRLQSWAEQRGLLCEVTTARNRGADVCGS